MLSAFDDCRDEECDVPQYVPAVQDRGILKTAQRSPAHKDMGSRQALVVNLLQHDQEEALPFIIVLRARQQLLDPTLDESDVKPKMQV